MNDYMKQLYNKVQYKQIKRQSTSCTKFIGSHASVHMYHRGVAKPFTSEIKLSTAEDAWGSKL